MTSTVHEPGRDIPVLAEVDVLVAGGGVAGCAAAVGSARAGARTMLLERNGCLGGVATATYMSNIGNLMVTADSSRIVLGFAADLIDRMIEQGGASRHWAHADVPGCVVDTERMKLVLIQMLEEAGVETLSHTVATMPIVEDGSARGVFIESKSGRQAVLAKTIVDATGEADLAFRAGAETKWVGGSASTLFKIGNVDLDRFVDFVMEDPDGFPAAWDMVRDAETFAVNWRERGILFFPHGGASQWRWFKELGGLQEDIPPAHRLNAFGLYAPAAASLGARRSRGAGRAPASSRRRLRRPRAGSDTVTVNSNFYTIEDLDIRNLSRFELHSQQMCYVVGEYMIKHVPGFERGHIVSMGSDLGIRSSRVIAGRATLGGDQINQPEEAFHTGDVIGCKPTRRGGWHEGTCRGNTTCDVPFGIIVPTGPANLLVASAKSVSTDPPAIIRSMAGCMVCGQAAGVASAVAADAGVPSADVPIRGVQAELLRQGVYLGDKDRLNSLALL